MSKIMRTRTAHPARIGSLAGRRWLQFVAMRRRHRHSLNRIYGTYHGYDPQNRARVDEEQRQKRRIEETPRKFLGIGPFDPWPFVGAGGYFFLYYVVDDVASAARGGIDATLCADCLNNEFPRNTVVAVDHGDGFDEPIYCDHCNRLLAGHEEGDEE